MRALLLAALRFPQQDSSLGSAVTPTHCFSFGIRHKPVADLPGGWSLVAPRSLLQAGVRRTSCGGQCQAPGPTVPAGEP